MNTRTLPCLLILGFLFLLPTKSLFAQDSLSNKSVKMDYAFLVYYKDGFSKPALDLYFSDGTYTDLKKVLKLDIQLPANPDDDNFRALSAAFKYLNEKGYSLISSSITLNVANIGSDIGRREYVFGKSK
jgi:hypothetical protein